MVDRGNMRVFFFTMPKAALFTAFLLASSVSGQEINSQSVTQISGSQSGALSGDDVLPTGSHVTYLSYSSTITLEPAVGTGLGTIVGTTLGQSSDMAQPNSTGSQTTGTSSSTTPQVTLLVGSQLPNQTIILNGTMTASANMTASETSTAAVPTNTQPCNGYVEFCERKYSNITEVCAHNSPFVRKGNAGSNQAYGVTTQLNDGIRMCKVQKSCN